MNKIDRLLDVIEHPDLYTTSEIETMLQDPEVKEVFDLLDKTKSSLQSIAVPDISEEWTKFANQHHQSKSSRRHWLPQIFSRNAAASIVVCIASFTAVAAIVGVGIHRISNGSSTTNPEVETTTVTDDATSQSNVVNSYDPDDETSPETVVFDNETLETILTIIGSYYGYTVTFNNDAAKSLRLYFRWNQALLIEDIAASLNNFEQINLTIVDRTIKID
ncbi:MAG: DUF4974 domain-containing protein [Muribaculaceae bacterium]|nr:DUF4974 domain-containing protein [Muribaculaceae bacterium]